MRKIFPLLFILIIQACAFKSAAVGQLDTLIEYQTASRLDLYRYQKQQLEKDVATLLTQQQKSLSDVKKLLSSLDIQKQENLQTQWSELTLLYHRLALAYGEILSAHLASLDKSQQKTFFAKMKEENQEIKDRANGQTVDKLEERAEFFLGDINDKQKEVFKRYLPVIKLRAEARLKRRESLLKYFKKTFEQKQSTKLKKTQIYQAFVSYQDETLKSQQDTYSLIKEITRLADAKQIKTFSEKKIEAIELLTIFEKTEY
jgi:hypothetical protein